MYGGTTSTLAVTGAAGLSVLGMEFGLVQVLAGGLALIAVGLIGYRKATKGKRHGEAS